jgi:hypothetical protein
LLLLD